MNSWIQEYKQTLKDVTAEEFFDLYLFRPIAFILIKLFIYRSSLTPNQLSFLSIITGISGGIAFSFGTPKSFLIAGILYGITRTIDCSDGMIARMKKNGTPTGRIIDGLADYINAASIFIGLGIGLSKLSFQLPVSPWLWIVVAAIFMTIHSITIDYYRSEFLSHALGKKNSTRQDKELFTKELKRIKKEKGKIFEKFLIKLYLGYLNIQVNKNITKKIYDKKKYYNNNKLLLRVWNIIGSSTYIFILMMSAVLYKPFLFFVYSFVIANICMIILLIIQFKTNQKITMHIK
jgi:phosphatidylglycerophosphate synthase